VTISAALLEPPSPEPQDDPGHLFTDAEWARIERWAAEAAAEREQVRLDLEAIELATVTVTRLDMPAKYHGGAQTPTLQVIHSAETPLALGYAQAIGQMFADGPAAGTSATKMIDPATVVTMLPLTVEAYHVGPVGNLDSVGYEQAGYAAFTRAQWTTSLGLDQLDILAAELAADGLAYGIPDRHLTDAQLAAWHANGRRLEDGGRCTHDQIHRVLGGTTHTDPMPNYPLDLLNAAVTRHRGGQPDPEEPDVLDANDQQFMRDLTGAGGGTTVVGVVQQAYNLLHAQLSGISASLGGIATDLAKVVTFVTAHDADATRILGRLDALNLNLSDDQIAKLAAAVDIPLDQVAEAVRKDLAGALSVAPPAA
jgi:hypothetical protein